jgi:hypothetical protein
LVDAGRSLSVAGYPSSWAAEVERIVATDDRLKEDARLGAWTTQHVAP